MINLEQREAAFALYQEAIASGARQRMVCETIGINPRTIQRWKKDGELKDDGRSSREFIPANKLTEDERQQVLSVANSAEYCDMTPNQIVPILAEQGQYVASERTFYRILKSEGQLTHRQSSQPKTRTKPQALVATGPGQIVTWDISYLKTTVLGQFLYLYLFLDIFSRKIVGWQIYDREDCRLASDILKDIARRERYDKNQVIVHSDNGSPMKGAVLLATLQKLGISPSYSRPSVSNDNPYSESLFKTVKYCPFYPTRPFNDLNEARQWMEKFTRWYNYEHRHSGIHYVTPAQRHAGLDIAILKKRKKTYELAKLRNPERWSGQTRDWNRQDEVLLNPDKNTERKKDLLAA